MNDASSETMNDERLLAEMRRDAAAVHIDRNLANICASLHAENPSVLYL
jgi:hypothetical protein